MSVIRVAPGLRPGIRIGAIGIHKRFNSDAALVIPTASIHGSRAARPTRMTPLRSPRSLR